MNRLKKGDPCPCCGQPIKTDDPEILQLLTEIADMRYIPTATEIAEKFNNKT